jgi:hypothetical protein
MILRLTLLSTEQFNRETPLIRERQRPADSVEKVELSARLSSGTTTTGEPNHHIEWLLGPSLTFAALLMGYLRFFASCRRTYPVEGGP